MSTTRDAQRRVRAFLLAHKENIYVGDDIQGMVGLNGKPLLRASDVRVLLDATTKERMTQ